jgi:SPP1 gp7 family putative phage head morphogenesis protein
MKNMEDALQDQSYSYVENLEKQFTAAQAEIERQMSVWYQRFAQNNEITLAEAKRLLNSGELKEFQWSVGEYIAYGQQNALDGAWMKQLENASARVHISRLDALKLQIQQQAEVLYSNQLDYVDAAARQMYTGSYYHTAFEVQKGLGVGWTMQSLNEDTIAKVLSRPWTADGQTFRDRCWTNKQSLVNSVNTQLTQMIIRGEAPDRAITAISKQFDVSRAKAGRLVMTESAYFSSAAQKDCFEDLGVEQYKIVASFDHDTCELCGALDGKVFKMSEYQVGLTAPPFHPWCRCCTCPYFADMEDLGERWTRDEDGSTHEIPANTTFEDWKQGHVKAGGTSPAQNSVATSPKPAIMDVVERAVGAQKGISMDMVGAISGANPNFSAGGAYHINCQRCVQTYELRRRGYDVIAKPKPSAGNTVSWGSECFIQPGQYQASWQAFTLNQTEAAVKKELAAAPDGARYAIYIKWKGRGTGAHVFIAEKSGGTVNYMDPQNGAMNASNYFSNGSKGHFGFFRMDDKALTTDENIIAATVEVKKP